MKAASIGALALLPLAALAQTPPEPATRVHFGVEHSHLDRGLADWDEASLRVSRQLAPRSLVEGALTETRRFGLKDTQLGAAFTTPLSDRLAASAELNYSPTHRVLAHYSAGGALQYEFAPAWLAHAGLRHTRYDNAGVERGMLMLEHYFGDFSASAAWFPARALGTHVSNAELRGSWYYREGSAITLIASRGDEATQVGPGAIALADVRSLAWTGRHRIIAPALALTWSLFRVHQGSFYTRTGASAGVQYAF